MSWDFVYRMEDVLDLYQEDYDPLRPVVCFDEVPYQLVGETRTPVPPKAGRPSLVDYEYRRCGTVNLFMLIEPLMGWRHVDVTAQRTNKDFAHQMRELVDVHYLDAHKIRIVLDNLSTHSGAALYEAFAPEEARRVLRKLEFHYTPKHGSWLNMAEIEISVLGRQCLNRRIDNAPAVRTAIGKWQAKRNDQGAQIQWRFTTSDARNKMHHVYSS